MYRPVHKLNRYIHLLRTEPLWQSISVLVLVSGRCRRRLIAVVGVEALSPEELSGDKVPDVIVLVRRRLLSMGYLSVFVPRKNDLATLIVVVVLRVCFIFE